LLRIFTMKRKAAGFTLIELLVVIAIIGILSAVVLASLNTARQKGSDAAIQSDLNTVRTEAEVYYNGAGSNSYTGLCTSDTAVVNALTAIHGITSVTPTCNETDTGDAYAADSQLVTNSSLYFCVDSTGVSTTTGTALGSTDTVCPTS
jgi:prepilin-type N-terminal cleavage/methylation domain-containing protein